MWEEVNGKHFCSIKNDTELSSEVHDNDHVDGVRQRLWTAATNGPIVYPSGEKWYGEPWWNIVDKGKLLILPPELSGKPISTVIY
jgi:hypothetical protein